MILAFCKGFSGMLLLSSSSLKHSSTLFDPVRRGENPVILRKGRLLVYIIFLHTEKIRVSAVQFRASAPRFSRSLHGFRESRYNSKGFGIVQAGEGASSRPEEHAASSGSGCGSKFIVHFRAQILVGFVRDD